MPKGRGSARRGRKKDSAPAPRSGNPLKRFEEATAALPRHQRKIIDQELDGFGGVESMEMDRRALAHEAGGFSREERRRSRQRTEEAQRLAARKLQKALRQKGSNGKQD